MTTQTVSDFLIKRINEWGLKRIYGYPGDGINGIIGAIDRANGSVEYVQVRHEEMAAFMACAHAKFTGEVGICLATSGPGAIHLLNGLYDAKMDHAGVVAIVGQQARAALGGDYQQEVDLMSLFKDVAHEYVHMASTPAQVRHLNRSRNSHRQCGTHCHLRHHSERCAGNVRGGNPATETWHNPFRRRLCATAGCSEGCRSPASSRSSKRWRENRDACGSWGVAGHG